MPTAAVNGIELYYEDVGESPAGEPPLLFHHGYTSSHERWDGVVGALRDRYRCVRFDARGTGASGRPATGYGIEAYAADVLGLADALGIERFTFLGHSLGGGVGYSLGVGHAERLHKLILLAPIPADGGEIPEQERRARLAPWYAKDLALLTRQRLHGSARPPSEEEAERGAKRVLAASEGHMTETLDAMEGLRLGDRLGEIGTPTLMIAGAADALLPYNLQDFARLGNATLHVFSRVGHGIPSEVPAALARVLPDFLTHGVVTAQTLTDRMQAIQQNPQS